MRRPLVAFLLASLTVAAIWCAYSGFTQTWNNYPNRIMVYAAPSAEDIADKRVSAIEALHLPDASVIKVQVVPVTPSNFVWGTLFFSVVLAILTGFVLFFYKLYSRWLRVTPHL